MVMRRGLKEYRQWLYQHVPAKALAEKKRDYLTPEEIDALKSLNTRVLRQEPAETRLPRHLRWPAAEH